MKDIRLFRLLKAFSADELKTFGKFIESPFSQQGRKTTELYTYLAKLHPDFSSLTRQLMFKELFKGEVYNERKLQNLIFSLTKSAEYFLAYSTLEENELEFSLILSKGFNNRKLYAESNSINKEIEKKLKPSFSPNKDYFSKLKQLSYLNYSYYAEKHEYTNMFKLMESLFEASALQFIFEYMQLVSNMKIASIEYGGELKDNFVQNILQNVDLEKLLKPLENENYIKTPYIGLHYYRFKTIIDAENLTHYNLLKDLLFNNLSNPDLDREEKWFFFSHLVNYCVLKMAQKIDVFITEAMEIYKKMFEHNSFTSSDKKYIDVMNFRNIILISTAQKDAEWLNYFIKNHIDCVHPVHRDNFELFGSAHLFFITGDYQKSLEFIFRVNNDFSLFKADIKNLLLKVYYELDDYDKAFTCLDTFRHFLRTNKEITETHKTPYRNFLKFYSDLIKVKCGDKANGLEYIDSKIKKDAPVASKDWLLEKADEIRKKVKNCTSAVYLFLIFELVSYFFESVLLIV